MSNPQVKLKYIAQLISGGTPEVSDETNWAQGEEGVSWVSIGDMSNRSKVSETSRRVSSKGIFSARLAVAPPGTLLMSMYASLGHTAFTTKPSAWNQAILAIIPQGEFDARFVNYSLIAQKVDLEALARSSTQSNLNAEQVRNLRISNLLIEEQRRIADFLDAEVGRIERLVAGRRSQMQALEERESSLISESFIPGSVGRASGEFPWPWLPRASERPPLVRLGYLCHVQGGITVDASREPSETDVTRPYLRVANVKADRLELDSVAEITVPKAVADRSTLQSGDVLMTEGGDIDKLGRGTVWNGELPGALHQNHVFALRPDSERLESEYLALLTRSLHGRCYFEATGVKSTNLASTSSSKVRSFPVPLIPLAEQRKAVVEVKGSLAEVGRLRAALIRQIDLLEERKRALITAAVTGQIDVTTARGADLS